MGVLSRAKEEWAAFGRDGKRRVAKRNNNNNKKCKAAQALS